MSTRERAEARMSQGFVAALLPRVESEPSAHEILLGIATLKITGEDLFVPTGYDDPFVGTQPCWCGSGMSWFEDLALRTNVQ